jgi:hypothetical protein
VACSQQHQNVNISFSVQFINSYQTYAISATTNAHQQCFSPFYFSAPYQLDFHATQCRVMQTQFMMHPFAHPSVNVFKKPHND